MSNGNFEFLISEKRHLDVSFNHNQMEQIRLGLKYNLEVSKYAKPEYSWQEMKQIREKLLRESTL